MGYLIFLLFLLPPGCSWTIVEVVEDHTLPSRPQGVRGRNSDNSLLRSVLAWEPKISLREKLVPTYRWIEECVSRQVQQRIQTAAE